MSQPIADHLSQPWRIHRIASGFRVLDVWALPTPGGPDDFPHLVELFAGGGFQPGATSPMARALFAIRWKLGEWLGWDDVDRGLGGRVRSLRDDLPASDDGDGDEGPAAARAPFSFLYRTDQEWAAELANATVHAVLHLGWVPDAAVPGGYRGQMAVLVKPNGWRGRAYLAAIAPFRHRIVYPSLLAAVASGWEPAGRRSTQSPSRQLRRTRTISRRT